MNDTVTELSQNNNGLKIGENANPGEAVAYETVITATDLEV